MKILFLGYLDSSLIAFLSKAGETVVPTMEKLSPVWVKQEKFDFLISYGYLHILKNDILSLFSRRAINLHISFLPWNRGKDPNFWSFVEGTPKGVTIHDLDEGIDTGNIICQKEMFFSNKETLKTSYLKLKLEIEKLFTEHWVFIKRGTCLRKKQPKKGSFHLAKDRQRLGGLLVKGWETPVSMLMAYHEKVERKV